MVRKTRKQKKQKGGMRSVARVLTPFAIAGLAQGQTPYPTFVPGTIFRNGVTGRHYLYDPSQGLQEVALATPSALPTSSFVPTAVPSASGYRWPNFSQLGNTFAGATRKIRNSNTMQQFGSTVMKIGSNVFEASKQLPGKAYNLGTTVKSIGVNLGESSYRRSRALANNFTRAAQAYLNPDGSVTVVPSPSALPISNENEDEDSFLKQGTYKFQTMNNAYTLGRGNVGPRIPYNVKEINVKNFKPSPNLTRMPEELFSHYFPGTSKQRLLNAIDKKAIIPSVQIYLKHPNSDKAIWLNERG